MEVLGASATVSAGSPGALLAGRVEPGAPVGPDPDVRRRHQRDPARHHRRRRAGLALQALTAREKLRRQEAGGLRSSRRQKLTPNGKRPGSGLLLSQAQTELAALSRQILTDRATPDRLAELERNGLGFDEALWADLAGAGVLAAALPEGVGDGYGLAEQCSILIEVGKTVAPVPYLESIACGAAAIARFGTSEQIARYAATAAAGDLVITVALAEPSGSAATTADRSGDGWVLTGTKTAVPAGAAAGVFLVSARTPDGTAVFCVEASRSGRPWEGQGTRSLVAGWAAQLDLAPGGAGPGSAARCRETEVVAPGWTARGRRSGLCALQLGVTERALELTAEYAKTREQIRLTDRGLPGGGPAASRRLHRCRGDQADHVAGGLAA